MNKTRLFFDLRNSYKAFTYLLGVILPLSACAQSEAYNPIDVKTPHEVFPIIKTMNGQSVLLDAYIVPIGWPSDLPNDDFALFGSFARPVPDQRQGSLACEVNVMKTQGEIPIIYGRDVPRKFKYPMGQHVLISGTVDTQSGWTSSVGHIILTDPTVVTLKDVKILKRLPGNCELVRGLMR